jgi:hypothetical protein
MTASRKQPSVQKKILYQFFFQVIFFCIQDNPFPEIFFGQQQAVNKAIFTENSIAFCVIYFLPVRPLQK